MGEGRTFDYSIHCTFKHMSGTVRNLREASAKIARIYAELKNEDRLSQEDENQLIELHRQISNYINGISSIIERLLDLYENGLSEEDRDTLIIIQALIGSYRAEIERWLINTRKFLRKLGVSDKEILAMTYDVLSCLGDLYCAEQDHIPELNKHNKVNT